MQTLLRQKGVKRGQAAGVRLTCELTHRCGLHYAAALHRRHRHRVQIGAKIQKIGRHQLKPNPKKGINRNLWRGLKISGIKRRGSAAHQNLHYRQRIHALRLSVRKIRRHDVAAVCAAFSHGAESRASRHLHQPLKHGDRASNRLPVQIDTMRHSNFAQNAWRPTLTPASTPQAHLHDWEGGRLLA